MFYKNVKINLYTFERDGFTKDELYSFFKGWRKGYDWGTTCTEHIDSLTITINFFNEELYLLFYMTYNEYIGEYFGELWEF